MGRPFSFPGKFRLKSRKSIETLFQASDSIMAHPILFKFSLIPAKAKPAIPQVAFTVSKKSFKKAILRNRIRRRMKEAFRINWKNFLEFKDQTMDMHLMVIYLGKEELIYKTIESSMLKNLQKLADFLQKQERV